MEDTTSRIQKLCDFSPGFCHHYGLGVSLFTHVVWTFVIVGSCIRGTGWGGPY